MAFLLTLTATVLRVAVSLPAEQLLVIGIALLGILAIGWAGRSATHVGLLYFWPLPRGRPRRYRLMLVSLLNVCFTALWMIAVLTLLREPDPLAAAAAAVAISALVFLLSLFTLSAARATGYERGSEWLRRHLRKALEPGRSTWLGWLLIVLIELRSPEEHLSTFVGGTLALLLVAAAMIAPAAIQEVAAQFG